MSRVASILLILSAPAMAQEVLPLIVGRPVAMIQPAVDRSGATVILGSSVAPDGTVYPPVDLYSVRGDGSGLRRWTQLAGGTHPPSGAMYVSLSADGRFAAFSAIQTPGKGEEIHLLDTAGGLDRVLHVYTEGCIQPACPNCFLACVHTPHVRDDGSAVLFAVANDRPLRVVKSDGSAPASLPVYTARLAPSSRRAVSREGTVVFASNAPFGPTFTLAAGEIYVMNFDGTNIRQVTRFGDPTVQAMDPTISADGSTIAFLAGRKLYTVRADGSALREVASGDVSAPSLSGDGSKVAWIVNGQVFVNGARLTSFRYSLAQDAVITEDGARVVFTIGPSEGNRGAVHIVNADGSGPRALFAPRSLNLGGIHGAVAGSLASAYGLNFTADTVVSASSLPLPESLEGVALHLNGRALRMHAVTPWQANAQIPPEQNEGPAAFEVRFADGFRTAPAAAEIMSFDPSVYLLPAIRAAQAAVLHANSATVVDTRSPARSGQVVQIYASGLGATEPLVPAGYPASSYPLARTLATPEVFIGGRSAQVLFSGLAPGFVGVYQINAVIPDGLRPGDTSVSLRVGGRSGMSGLISLQ